MGGGSLSDASTTQLQTCDDDNDDDDDDDDDDHDDNDDDETVAVGVRQSLGRYPRAMYVGPYENHVFTSKIATRSPSRTVVVVAVNGGRRLGINSVTNEDAINRCVTPFREVGID